MLRHFHAFFGEDLNDARLGSKLVDPDDPGGSERDVVIFDGQCKFCRAAVRQLRWMDTGGRLAYLSLHDPRVPQRYPDLSHDQLMREMYVVDTDGTAHGGSDAVKYLSRRLPVLWGAMPVLHLPGTAGLWRWGYHQVAKRRYRLAGKTDGNAGCDDACAVHFGDQSSESS